MNEVKAESPSTWYSKHMPRISKLYPYALQSYWLQTFEKLYHTRFLLRNGPYFSSLPRGLDNLAMGPKQHHLYSKPEYINSQHASLYCNHNMVRFTAISTTTCFTLLRDTPQPGSFHCNITTCFILLQYQSQHASFYWNMLHFTAISTTIMLHFTGTCFISLE